MADPQEFILPAKYTFTPGMTLMHETSWERLKKLAEQAQNSDPDAHGLYIYNDFFGYAILDLVDRTLSSIHTLVVKKKWLDAFYAIVALTYFMDMNTEWLQIDNGERVDLTNQAYSALVVKTLHSLAAADPPLLNEATLPDLEGALKAIAQWAEDMDGLVGGPYGVVAKGYGKKLFGERTAEEHKRIKEAQDKAYERYVGSLSDAQREERGDLTPEERKAMLSAQDDEDEEKDEGVWFDGASADDVNTKDDSFKITPVWKAYKECIASFPDGPMRGPCWDLTEWSAAEKKQFSLSNY
ncbi:hypothetical protein EVG20_g2688 [Dentipellis fragilis]|uniref:Uncharacterized protein n=1 Tax=Dentipellis fragilis TaxID=205917 RepID=A0A4Y9Z639_9AGAM|nr:hypothetical protein EVG20_g2688 [Dentipellis fragilis]